MKARIIWAIIIVVILVIIGVLVWNFVGRKRVPIPEEVEVPTEIEVPEVIPPEEIEVPEVEKPVVEEKTPIEIAFEKARDVEITAEKAKALDAVLRPVLKSVFDTVDEKGQPISGVKMKEEFGPMLTYVFNRMVTEAERDAVITGLEEVGVKVVDRTEKVITVQKNGAMWVITFYLNNEQKAGLEITF